MIIGIAGNAGVGKDTCADHMVKNHGFVKVSLADPLKRIVRDVFDFSDEQLWGSSEKRNEPDTRYPKSSADFWPQTFLTPRHALQQLGTEFGRACYADIWVQYALRIHERLQAGGVYYDQKDGLHSFTSVEGVMRAKQDIVISDVRFPNEVDAIRATGGKVWKLTRPIPRLEGAAGQHQSETALDGISAKLFHAFIDNSDSFEKLYQSVDFCLGEK